MKTPFCLFAILVILATLSFFGCKDKVEDPKPDNETELITTLTLTFEAIGETTVIAQFKDIDGAGGNAPTIDPIDLKNGISYTMKLTVLDESDALNIHDITQEIDAESDQHQFFFTGTAFDNGLVSYDYNDLDENLLPIGLEGTVSSLAIGTGTFIVTLKHQPDQKSTTSGISTGETDVEISFEMSVE